MVSSSSSGKLNIPVGLAQWYSFDISVGSQKSKDKFKLPKAKDISFETAKILYEEEVNLYESKHNKMSSADKDWFLSMMKSGTTSDKLSAITMAVNNSPFHSLKHLTKLVDGMIQKKARRDCLLAVETTKDLFLNVYLPDTKLISFDSRDRSLANNRELIFWYFEDQVKSYYKRFLLGLEELCKDPLDFVRSKTLYVIWELLVLKPEMESSLLALLVNKLGDVQNKIASKVSHLLLKLLEKHPAMTMIVISEVWQLIIRSNISYKAQYYALIFLNQIILTKSTATEIAKKLIEIYFNLFDKWSVELKEAEQSKKVIQPTTKKNKKLFKSKKLKEAKKSTQDITFYNCSSKLMQALLTGIRRTVPFIDINDEKILSHTNSLFILSHIGHWSTSLQALLVLFQFVNGNHNSTFVDRCYRTLYELLFDQRIDSTSKHTLFLSLLYKALSADATRYPNRVKAFFKRIFQICLHQQPPFIASCLAMISQIIVENPILNGILNQFVLLKTVDANAIPNSNQTDDDDEQEHFEDATEENPITVRFNSGTSTPSSNPQIPLPDKARQNNNSSSYDPSKRDPKYSNVEFTPSWELSLLSNHYHPTVAFYATKLIYASHSYHSMHCNGYDAQIEKEMATPISPPSDPFSSFSTMMFLSRFINKKPKGKTSLKGDSIMQKISLPTKTEESMLPSEELFRMKKDQVPAHEQFLKSFVDMEYKDKKPSGKLHQRIEAAADGTSDSEFDQLLFKDNNQDENEELDEEDDMKVELEDEWREEELNSNISDFEGEEEEMEDDEDELVNENDLDDDASMEDNQFQQNFSNNDDKDNENVDNPHPSSRIRKSRWAKKAASLGIDISSSFVDASQIDSFLLDENDDVPKKKRKRRIAN